MCKGMEGEVKTWVNRVWRRWLEAVGEKGAKKPKKRRSKKDKSWEVEIEESEDFGGDKRASGVLLCLELYRATRVNRVSMTDEEFEQWRKFVVAKTLVGADKLIACAEK